MQGRIAGWVRASAVSVGFTFAGLIAVALVCEIGVRLAGVDLALPRSLFSPGMRTDLLLGSVPGSLQSGLWLPPRHPENFEVLTDEHGFRLTGFEPSLSPSATVAVLGDSCTFGWGVDTPDTYLAQLDAIQRESGDPKLAFINAGVPGNSAVAGVHHLRERVLPFSPDVVVLAFSGNNAFRLSLVSDVQRFNYFGLRKVVFNSHLVQLATIRVAAAAGPKRPSRNRQLLQSVSPAEWNRVANPDEFAWAMRTMVADAREIGAKPLFLLFPRAGQVAEFRIPEDAARFVQRNPIPPREGEVVSLLEMSLLESTCLDVRDSNFVDQLRTQGKSWQPLRAWPAVRKQLKNAVLARLRGQDELALGLFREAAITQPDNPLALYDLGVMEIETGDTESGLARLGRASQLACNVFLQYQVILRELAVELEVPVVDMLMAFQAYDAEAFMLDAAHFTQPGNRVVAEALWKALGPEGQLSPPIR